MDSDKNDLENFKLNNKQTNKKLTYSEELNPGESERERESVCVSMSVCVCGRGDCVCTWNDLFSNFCSCYFCLLRGT